jgi:YidC/Oxa1 family membrane protein insertase
MVQTYPDGWLPLALETGDPDLDARLRQALFVASSTRLQVSGDDSAVLELRYSEGELAVEKTLRFRGRGYVTAVSATLRRGGEVRPVRVLWGPGIGNPSEAEREVQGYQEPGAVVMAADGDVERLQAEDLEPPIPFAGAAWAGVESQYFAALWIPQSAGLQGQARRIDLPTAEVGELRGQPQSAVALSQGEAVELFVGPKDYFLLAEINPRLARVVPVGEWIGPIVVPLMRLLRWVHSHLGNYGWSIVVLTILINLAMAPLRHFSIANGIKMAKLAPEMRVIQERYRKVPALDPKRQEMQKEVAALYARHGMSMSTQLTVGCLPLLLTMPFLIAFYRVLQSFIELRGASFLWIPDLSQKDPLFLTPILMGASMFLMQRMMPSTMDPAQQRMMMIMPLVLLGMFLWAPAGLNLYWLSANVCSIVQQGTTMSILKARGEGPVPGGGGGPPAGKSKSTGKGRRR